MRFPKKNMLLPCDADGNQKLFAKKKKRKHKEGGSRDSEKMIKKMERSRKD